jgi:hypothetical protein
MAINDRVAAQALEGSALTQIHVLNLAGRAGGPFSLVAADL